MRINCIAGKHILVAALTVSVCCPGLARAQLFDDLLNKGMNSLSETKSLNQAGAGLSEDSIISGLKEALVLSVGKSIDAISSQNGYQANL